MSKPTPVHDDWDRGPSRPRRNAEDWLTLGHKFATYLVAVVIVGGIVPAWNWAEHMRETIDNINLVTTAAASAQAVRDQAQNEALQSYEKYAGDRMDDHSRRLTFLENREFGITK